MMWQVKQLKSIVQIDIFQVISDWLFLTTEVHKEQVEEIETKLWKFSY